MSLKIVLADDSMTAQNMGKKILADAGYEVIAVSNGAAAIKKIAEVKPDLLVLDIFMPGYTGLEVCERIKAAPETANIPVLLTVGKLEPYRPEDGAKAHAEGVIIKPFEATDLLAAVKKLGETAAASMAAHATAVPAPVMEHPAPQAVPQASTASAPVSATQMFAVSSAAPVEQYAPAMEAPMFALDEELSTLAPLEPVVEAAAPAFVAEEAPVAEPHAEQHAAEVVEAAPQEAHGIVAPEPVEEAPAEISLIEAAPIEPANIEAAHFEVAELESFAAEPAIAELKSAAPTFEAEVIEAAPTEPVHYEALAIEPAAMEVAHTEAAHDAPAFEVFEVEELLITPEPQVAEPSQMVDPEIEPTIAPAVEVETAPVAELETMERADAEVVTAADPNLVTDPDELMTFSTHFVAEPVANDAVEEQVLESAAAVEITEADLHIPTAQVEEVAAQEPTPESAVQIEAAPEALEVLEVAPAGLVDSEVVFETSLDRPGHAAEVAADEHEHRAPAVSVDAGPELDGAIEIEPLDVAEFTDLATETPSHDEMYAVEVPAPEPAVAEPAQSQAAAPTTTVSSVRVAAAVQKVLDRYREQMIADIVKELNGE